MNVFIIGSENKSKDSNYIYHFKRAADKITYMDFTPINPIEEWPKYVNHMGIKEPTRSDRINWERKTIVKSDYIYILDTSETDPTALKLIDFANSMNKKILKIKINR